ncbi:MAG: penicillin acylase family protein [Polyangiaceae bacterium]|nr:penicillin acylase family protein [Polyangiaceae bacterium]
MRWGAGAIGRGALLVAGVSSCLLACGEPEERAPVAVTPGSGGPALASGEMEIVVDSMGVPHIYATTDEDLFFAYGRQLAKDRMLQLEMWRRFARGLRSEVLGADYPGSFGATALQDDQLVRLFRLPKWGALDAALMREEHPERWKLLQAWRAGINATVAEITSGAVPRPFGFGADELDFLPAPWTEDDPLIVQKMIQLGLDQTILYEILVTLLGSLAPEALASVELFRPAAEVWQVPPEDLPVGARGAAALGPAPPAGRDVAPGAAALPRELLDPAAWSRMARPAHAGSNSWAVSGAHTASGRPMLAGDPHLVFTLMGNMYAVHLNSAAYGGTFDAAGFAFTPAAGLFAGHNADLAWTPTSAFGDVMDLWAVPADAEGVEIAGQVVPLEITEEIIPLRSGGDASITLEDVPGYGVVFQPGFAGVPLPIGGPGRKVVIGWTGFRARSSLYFLELARARTVTEFEAAVMRIPEMSYNWVAVDRKSLTYRVSLEVPKRNEIVEGREPWRVMDGTDPLAWWPGGSLPADQLPSGRAASRGLVVTANNDPFGFSANGRLDDDPWYYGAFFDPGYRAKRIEDELVRLTSSGEVDLAAMQRLQMDVHSGMADDLLPLLEAAWGRLATDPALAEFRGRPELAALVEVLRSWDRRMARDSPGALAFHAWAHFTTGVVLEDDIISLLYEQALRAAPFYVLKVAILALKGEYPQGDGVLQEGRDWCLLQGLSLTAELLTQRYGGVDPAGYRYSDLRVSAFDNAFGLGVALPSFPTDGGEDTVNVGHSVFRADLQVLDQWVSNYGPVERMVTHFPTPKGHPEAWVNFPLGNVADRESPHFDDMMRGWIEGEYQRLLYAWEDVDAAAESRARLTR